MLKVEKVFLEFKIYLLESFYAPSIVITIKNLITLLNHDVFSINITFFSVSGCMNIGPFTPTLDKNQQNGWKI